MISARLSTREDSRHLVVTLRGDLDVVAADRVAAALATAVARNPRILIDLAELEFIDCSGLRVLAAAREQARQCGGDLLLAAPRRQVARLLTLTGLAGVFSIHASLAGAVQAAPAQPVRRSLSRAY
jgi:anti-sigma B factor antagonist